MLPNPVSNPGPLTYESGALPIALRGLYWYRNVLLPLCGPMASGFGIVELLGVDILGVDILKLDIMALNPLVMSQSLLV